MFALGTVLPGYLPVAIPYGIILAIALAARFAHDGKPDRC